MNGKIVHIADDGTQTDVTEGVQALYDLVLSSMDWGSGFWTYEDAVPVVKIARLAGFAQAEEAERYAREALHTKESQEWQGRQASWPQAYNGGRAVPHEHVWSSAGKCMWFACLVQQGEPAQAQP